jgi:hypothetical protein
MQGGSQVEFKTEAFKVSKVEHMESNKTTFELYKEIFVDCLDIHPDDMDVLESSINDLVEAKIGMIQEIKLEENNAYNWVMLLITDEDQTYYLELTEHGSIVVLRKDNPDGEIIIDLLDDDFDAALLPSN